MNNLRKLRQILYKLKRDFGQSLNLVWKLSSEPDLSTGQKTVTYDSVEVKRGIVLPESLDRNFTYALAFIASNKNFTYGGFYDVNKCRVIIPKDELPADFEIKIGYYFITDGTRYEVESVTDFKIGFVIVGKQIDNITINNVIEKSVYSEIFFQQGVSNG